MKPEVDEFDAYADDYARILQRGLAASGESSEFFCRGRLAWLARRLDGLRSRPSTVLDYGCGVGMATPFFFEYLRAETMVGLDVSRSSLARARKQHGGERAVFMHPSEYQPRQEIELAYCNGVFHHVPPARRLDALQYIARCLRPDGLFALWENNPWSPGTRYVMSRTPFDRDAQLVWPREAARLLRTAGFQVLRKDFCFIFPRALNFMRWLEPLVCRCPFGAQYLVLGRLSESPTGGE